MEEQSKVRKRHGYESDEVSDTQSVSKTPRAERDFLLESVSSAALARRQARGNRAIPELLAPAGGMEQLKYAVHFGADAVYLATDKFGLRQRADNFSLEDIPRAVAFAHSAGVRVFVTCNAYLHDEDNELLPEYLEKLEAAQVDALIVSDLGVLRLAKKHAPHTAIHVSTQAACSNTQAALMWYELGARRIVCAREMSLAEIVEMKKHVPEDLEIEVFAHGAMCMAISGRCLISDYLTGRSANKGHCTQPCRWNYALGTSEENQDILLAEKTRPGKFYPIEEDERGTYIMNSKDLNMLHHLDDLVDAGVDSIKIEGRNKKAFYVATVVNAYRQVLDGADPNHFNDELNTVSHRPYSTGFFYGPAEQSSEEDEYIQRYDWVGEVLESDSSRTHIACRNRLYEGDVLEVLSPERPIRKVHIKNLAIVYSDGTEEPIELANRSMACYSFDTDAELSEGDILRSKRIDPSRKN